MPLELIDKQDNFEIIADQIAAILKLESAAQVAAATTAGKPDPNLWDLRVFQDRSKPWELFPSKTNNETPVVNVWFDSMSLQENASSTVDQQKYTGTFNIDVLGYGVSTDTAEGHDSGDYLAVQSVKRAVRLVRNILAASTYTYLGLRGLVWKRAVNSVDMFQPQQDDKNVHNITGARIAFLVEFAEYSPQYQGEILETLSVQVTQAENGEVIVDQQFNYPT